MVCVGELVTFTVVILETTSSKAMVTVVLVFNTDLNGLTAMRLLSNL